MTLGLGPAAGARVLGVHVGKVADRPYRDRTIRSAFAKRPVVGAVAVTPLGLDGDEQGDRDKHGGPDKAICVFPSEHYRHFERQLGRPLERPAFGENLTTSGLHERNVCVGDRLSIGTALCEVSLPRNPCFRVGAYHGARNFALWMERSGLTGFYLRVLCVGELVAGSPVELADRPHPHASVAEANRLMHRDKDDWPAVRALLAIPQLGANWRRTFERRLERREIEDASIRRYGPPADPPQRTPT